MEVSRGRRRTHQHFLRWVPLILAETGVALLFVGPHVIWAFSLMAAGIALAVFVGMAQSLEFGGYEDAGVDERSILNLHDK